MRLAYVCADPGFPVFGHTGCSVHVQEVLRALSKRGIQIVLFATHLGGDPSTDLETLRVIPLPKPSQAERVAREQQALAANLDLHRALMQHGPFDVVYERYSLWSFSGMEYARAGGTPALLEVNAPLLEEHALCRGLADRASAERIAEWVFRDATALIAVSEEVKAYLERFPTTRGRVHVVPNGVDPERFHSHLPPHHTWDAVAQRLLHLARLNSGHSGDAVEKSR